MCSCRKLQLEVGMLLNDLEIKCRQEALPPISTARTRVCVSQGLGSSEQGVLNVSSSLRQEENKMVDETLTDLGYKPLALALTSGSW